MRDSWVTVFENGIVTLMTFKCKYCGSIYRRKHKVCPQCKKIMWGVNYEQTRKTKKQS